VSYETKIFYSQNLTDYYYIFVPVEEYLLSDPELKDKIPVEYLSHADRYAAELRKACLMAQKIGDSPAGQVETLRFEPKQLHL